MSFYFEKREIVSNQARLNNYSLLYNKIKGQNNVSPSCDGIIMWVDSSYRVRYSSYQMDKNVLIFADSGYGWWNTNMGGLLKFVVLIDEKFHSYCCSSEAKGSNEGKTF